MLLRPPTPPTPPDAELLDVRAMARLCGCCEKSVYNMAAAGLLPKPLKLGKCTRWLRSAVMTALTSLHQQAQQEGGAA